MSLNVKIKGSKIRIDMKTLLEKTEERWSNNKINTLQAANILVGYTGGIINCVKTRDLLCRTREIRLALEKYRKAKACMRMSKRLEKISMKYEQNEKE